MTSLDSLYTIQEDTTACSSCKILSCKKSVHTYIDYSDAYHTDVLFLSDSLKYNFGEIKQLDDKSDELLHKLVKNILPNKSYQVLASVKCPDVREQDMKPKDMEACRYYLQQTIRKVQPKLIIPLGNLAMKMLIKKSGITDKRGHEFTYTLDNISYPVVPTLHPFALIKSPKDTQHFQLDIKNAYEKIVLGNSIKVNYKFKIINDVRDLQDYEWLHTTDMTLAIDLETEGLNFNTDKIMTMAICWGEEGIVIPFFHKECPRTELDLNCVINFVRKLCENENNIKVGHNFKFDMRFLLKLNINVLNAYDTKVMAHFIDQNMKKGLKDLVKLHFPNVLDKL